MTPPALRRLRSRLPRGGPDLRPGLMAVIGLLFLLLPFLLLTTSLQKLCGLPFGLAASPGDLAVLPTGRVEAVEVHLQGQDLVLRSAVRTLDVTASQGDVTWSEVTLPPRDGAMDLTGLQRELATVAALDPDHHRVLLVPADDTPTAKVIALVDAVRSQRGRELFPDVVLGGADLSAPAAPEEVQP
ncbi:MAG: hypothetical protein ABIO70_37010 [Pseudomonadota bacterium]